MTHAGDTMNKLPKTRQYREFRTEDCPCLLGLFDGPNFSGLVQVVEIGDGECVVGYKPDATGHWQHWGMGEGGYEATLEQFSSAANGLSKPECVAEEVTR